MSVGSPPIRTKVGSHANVGGTSHANVGILNLPFPGVIGLPKTDKPKQKTPLAGQITQNLHRNRKEFLHATTAHLKRTIQEN